MLGHTSRRDDKPMKHASGPNAAILVALGAVAACWPGATAIAEAKASEAAVEACADDPYQDDPDLLALREGMLAPGSPMTVAAIPPGTREKAAQAHKFEQASKERDWANLCRYKNANAKLVSSGHGPTTVFMGDSISEFWREGDSSLFAGGNVNRGISGQTSSQMLLRFYGDVIRLRPRVVHLLAGTNDVAANTGPISDDDFLGNILAMIDLAEANRVKMVLGSIPPAASFFWNPKLQPAERIDRLNQRLRRLAAERRLEFVDYFAALSDDQGGLRAGLSNDGVHPNRSGYAVMRPLAEAAIKRALHRVP